MDLAACDAHVRTYALEAEYRALAAAGLDCETIDLLRYTSRMRKVIFSNDGAIVVEKRPVKPGRPAYGVRPTGGNDTSIGNTLVSSMFALAPSASLWIVSRSSRITRITALM